MITDKTDPSFTLWILDCPAQPVAADIADCVAVFSASELDRLRNMRAPRRQAEYLYGHSLLRRALDHSCPGWDAEASIYHADGEPPRLLPHRAGNAITPLYFNLTHCDGKIACAVSRDRRVGIDIEDRRRERRFDELVRNYFAHEERREWETCLSEARADWFYHLWTLKESYIKARLDGISSTSTQTAFRVGSSEVAAWWSYSLCWREHWQLGLTVSAPLPETIVRVAEDGSVDTIVVGTALHAVG